jgi:uncharacterized repeat protein (TIGR01451 family)
VRLFSALALALFISLATAGLASAATQLGEVAPPGTTDSGGGFANVTEFQRATDVSSPRYAAPSNGVITSWSVNAGTGTGQVELRVFRPTTVSSQYRIAGLSGYQFLTSGRVNTFPTQIPVATGDKFGMKVLGNPVMTYTGVGADNVGFIADGAQGDTVSESFSGSGRMNLAATLEPDADGDGFGDETQDQCPSEVSTHGSCADLAIEVRATPQPVLRGGTIAYTVTVRNTSTTVGARNVTARLSVPPSNPLLPRTVSTAACSTGVSPSGDFMGCDFGNLGPGASSSVTVSSSAPDLGRIQVGASVSHSAVDPNPSNNAASATTDVTYDAVRHCAAANLSVGTDGNDRLTATKFSDPIYSGKGNDVVFGLGGNDCIFAEAGNDRVNAGAGNDRVDGGPGRDRILGGSGRDRIFGRAGNDRIDASDRTHDTVDCGPGRDTVIARRGDRLRHCERVRIKRR